MGQADIVVGVEHCQLMLQAVLALAQRVDLASYRGHPLANVQVSPSITQTEFQGMDRRPSLLQQCIVEEHVLSGA
jgi:hypothetical protein